ncbi:MAG: LptF/LptG family permease [Pseudomonadota bacterium]
MIFRRYLLRELYTTWVLWMIALLLVLFSVVAAKTFKQIDIQALELSTWVRLFGINGLRYFPYLLAIATYLAIFNTSSRYWHDGEIWVWRNIGVTPALLLRNLTVYLLPLTLLIAFFSFWLVPWSFRQGALEQLAMARTPFTRFSQTSQFLRFPSGLTVRIEGKNAVNKQDANTVFVFRERGQGTDTEYSSIWAKSAELEPQNERVVLALNEGVLKQYRASDIAPKLDMSFKRFHYVFSLPNPKLSDNPRWMPITQLWNATTSKQLNTITAEFFWRLSFPLHVLIVSWMGWSLGRHNSRAGQSANILSLILIDQLYLNIINLLQKNFEKGQLHLGINFSLALALHGIFAYAAWRLWLRQSK